MFLQKPNQCSAATLIVVILISSACGSVAGNPKNPGSNPPAKDTISIEIPSIDFEIDAAINDQPIADLALTGVGAGGEDRELALGEMADAKATRLAERNSVIKSWGARTAYTLKHTLNILKQLKEDQVQQSGLFQRKGPFAKMSGEIAVREGDAEYPFGMIACDDGRPALTAKWNADASRIVIARDFAVRPLDKKSEQDIIAEISIQRDGSTTKTTFHLEGLAWKAPGQTEGLRLREYTETTKGPDNFVILGVQDWSEGSAAPGGAGDGYLTGRITNDVKEFVAYQNILKRRCDTTFDESAATNPGWCVGGIVSKDDPEFTKQEVEEAALRLKDLGWLRKSNLRTPLLDNTLVCPKE